MKNRTNIIITIFLTITFLFSSAWATTPKLSDFITPVAPATIQHLKETASTNPQAAYQLATFYLQGNIDPDHYAENKQTYSKLGIQYLQQAAAANYVPAEVMLGKEYYEGALVPYNGQAALALFEKAAKSNARDAQVMLAYFYKQGILITQNAVLANKYKILAMNNSTDKNFYPSLISGMFQILSFDEGKDWLKQFIHNAIIAANHNDSYAEMSLCYYYSNIPGIKGNQNFQLAKKWCLLSAKQGLVNYNFMANLARSQQNYPLELIWLQQGLLYSYYAFAGNLTSYYLRGVPTISNISTAKQLIKQVYEKEVALQQQGELESNYVLLEEVSLFTIRNNSLLPDTLSNIKAHLQTAIDVTLAHNTKDTITPMGFGAIAAFAIDCKQKEFSDLNGCSNVQQYIDLGIANHYPQAQAFSGLDDALLGYKNKNPALIKQGVALLETAFDNDALDTSMPLNQIYSGSFDIPGYSAKNLIKAEKIAAIIAFLYPGQEDILAKIYVPRYGFSQNAQVSQGIKLYIAAAKEGNPYAAMSLSRIYGAGLNGQKRNLGEAIYYADLAVSIMQAQGYPADAIKKAKHFQSLIHANAVYTNFIINL
ncbi:MAG: tetratricopeptide repeat protein [Gammaproteobacteria bacterium]